MDFSLTITYVTTFIIFLYFIYMHFGIFSNKKGNINSRTPPKVAGSWPVIGHLHLLSGSNLPRNTFGLMADKYGPIFTVKFGAHQVLVALLAGGSDTTVVALTWTLSLLLNNPHVMQKAQEELGIQVGRNKLVDESHITNSVYLQAIAKELLRLYPPGPLSTPHESMED
ncbi:hypothetical protein H5410_024480 [Solanum commersonii]|uniref:Cytochrome P450 n=1 Tax=Solanum commersonii TaxID=4109 RepID=A0A9J5ZM51_SOLCO|nr:hypothetical protein H5410_024480 [Solanum commersonii]